LNRQTSAHGDHIKTSHAIIAPASFHLETSRAIAYGWATALPEQLTYLEGAAAKALQAAFIVEEALRTKRDRIRDISIADYEAMQTVIQSADRLWSSSRNVARQKFATVDLMRKLTQSGTRRRPFSRRTKNGAGTSKKGARHCKYNIFLAFAKEATFCPRGAMLFFD
jgi:hypothetical protein